MVEFYSLINHTLVDYSNKTSTQSPKGENEKRYLLCCNVQYEVLW